MRKIMVFFTLLLALGVSSDLKAVAPIYRSSGYHTVMSKAFNGESVKTEDGTLWGIAPTHFSEIESWFIGDSLILYPATTPYAHYNYLLTNTRRNTSTPVYILDGPLLHGPYTKEIISIDYQCNTIRLSDNTYWEVSNGAILEKWRAGDAVIIGLNNAYIDPLSPIYGKILLHTGSSESISARHYK